MSSGSIMQLAGRSTWPWKLAAPRVDRGTASVSTSSTGPGPVSLQTNVPFTRVMPARVPMLSKNGSPARTRPFTVNCALPLSTFSSALPLLAIHGAGVPATHRTPTLQLPGARPSAYDTARLDDSDDTRPFDFGALAFRIRPCSACEKADRQNGQGDARAARQFADFHIGSILLVSSGLQQPRFGADPAAVTRRTIAGRSSVSPLFLLC